jgi:hypothetical protein
VLGVSHVSGGPGADTWDGLAIIAAWVENGTAPDNITAEHWENDAVVFTRPLFPYPLHAYYDGVGDPLVASSFYGA